LSRNSFCRIQIRNSYNWSFGDLWSGVLDPGILKTNTTAFSDQKSQILGLQKELDAAFWRNILFIKVINFERSRAIRMAQRSIVVYSSP